MAAIERMSWLSAEARATVLDWLDADRPPTPSAVRALEARIREAELADEAATASLTDLGLALWRASGAGQRPWSSKKAHAGLRRLEDALGVHGTEVARSARGAPPPSPAAPARLVVAGEDHGVHAVLVPIRDDAGRTLPGVRIEDCGLKEGLNGVDNGTIWFDSVRVPRASLLDRFATIDDEGRYRSPIPSAGRRFFRMLRTLVVGRVSIATAAVSASKVGLTIAIRYAGERRQFGPEGGAEQVILDYPLIQRALMPRLATTYALHFAVRGMQSDLEVPERVDLTLRKAMRYLAERAETALGQLNPVVTRRTDAGHLLDPDFQRVALAYREERLLRSAAQRIRARLDEGTDSFQAVTQVQDHLVTLARAHVERLLPATSRATSPGRSASVCSPSARRCASSPGRSWRGSASPTASSRRPPGAVRSDEIWHFGPFGGGAKVRIARGDLAGSTK